MTKNQIYTTCIKNHTDYEIYITKEYTETRDKKTKNILLKSALHKEKY